MGHQCCSVSEVTARANRKHWRTDTRFNAQLKPASNGWKNGSNLSSPFQRKQSKTHIHTCSGFWAMIVNTADSCFNWCQSKRFIWLYMKEAAVCSPVLRSMLFSRLFILSKGKNTSQTKQQELLQNLCFKYLRRALVSFKSWHVLHFLKIDPNAWRFLTNGLQQHLSVEFNVEPVDLLKKRPVEEKNTPQSVYIYSFIQKYISYAVHTTTWIRCF